MGRWQIFTAIALRRMPELLARPDPIEARVQDIFHRYESGISRLSTHELQHLEDLRLKEEDNPDVAIKETAQDREELWAKDMASFSYGSHDERLTYTHYLFVKQKFGDDIKEQWLLPQTTYDENQDQDLLQTARRIMRERFNVVNGYNVIGKVPSSHYSFRYPKKVAQSSGFIGAKLFFMKANLDNPSKAVLESFDETKSSDLKWLTEREAHEMVHKRYIQSFSRGLLSEARVDAGVVMRRAARYSRDLKAASRVTVYG